MDDEVLELTRKCAQAMGYHIVYADDSLPLAVEREGIGAQNYYPSKSDAQAFELLCWLAQHAGVSIDMHPNIDGFFACLQIDPGVYFREQPISTPAELRLALMRATVKVHEGRGK